MEMGVDNAFAKTEIKKWSEETLGDLICTNQNNISKDYKHNDILYLDTGSITKNKIEIDMWICFVNLYTNNFRHRHHHHHHHHHYHHHYHHHHYHHHHHDIFVEVGNVCGITFTIHK